MSRIDAVLILGCNGNLDDDNFIFCTGSDNPILYLKDLEDFKYEEMVDFFDNACGLFDFPVTEHNKCTNILNVIYKNKKVIDSEMLEKIQYYLNMHKKCGSYLTLMLREDYDGQ